LANFQRPTCRTLPLVASLRLKTAEKSLDIGQGQYFECH